MADLNDFVKHSLECVECGDTITDGDTDRTNLVRLAGEEGWAIGFDGFPVCGTCNGELGDEPVIDTGGTSTTGGV